MWWRYAAHVSVPLVGTVMVLDKRILTTGFNGSPAGLPHCDEAGHLMVDGHCVRTIHAEANAIIQAALHGVSTKGSTCYVTHFPCIQCAKMLINAGVVRIVYDQEYRIDENTLDFLHLANVELVRVIGEEMTWSNISSSIPQVRVMWMRTC